VDPITHSVLQKQKIHQVQAQSAVQAPQSFLDTASFRESHHHYFALLSTQLASPTPKRKLKGLLKTTDYKEVTVEAVQILKHCLMISFWNPMMKE
jgi:hypothetical protein